LAGRFAQFSDSMRNDDKLTPPDTAASGAKSPAATRPSSEIVSGVAPSAPLSPGLTGRELVRRLRTHILLKAVGTPLFMVGFFVGYFLLLKHPITAVTLMPVSAPDRWISFQPAALVFYLSLWFYVALVPALIDDRRELVIYGWALGWLCLAGLGIFLVWPTAIPPPEINWSEHRAFLFLKSVDAAGNACPSLHVTFAVFSSVWFDRLLRRMHAGVFVRAINFLWCTAILYSTLAIKQHVTCDVVAGIALGAIAVAIHTRYGRSTIAPRS
jgi:hypothetical protein